jgi:hypothetical protein
LFRSLPKSARARSHFKVVYEPSPELRITYSGDEALGVNDMRILQGLVAMAGHKQLVLHAAPKTEQGRELRELLMRREPGLADASLQLAESSCRALLDAIGMQPGGLNVAALRASIKRMAGVRITVERVADKLDRAGNVVVKDGKRVRVVHEQMYPMLLRYESCHIRGEPESGWIFVALNPEITKAILGEKPWTRIDLDEVRALSSDPARLLHQRLCAFIDQGKVCGVSVDTLVEYVWPRLGDETTPSASRARGQRKQIREALDEIREQCGWSIERESPASDVYLIGRPKTKPARIADAMTEKRAYAGAAAA